MKFRIIWRDFVDLIFPRCCAACDKGLIGNEVIICTACRIGLPRIKADGIQKDTLHQKFIHIPEILGTHSFLLFTKKGKVQKLLHELKYRGHSELGVELGYMFGQEMLENGLLPGVDLIVSVPLHKRKMAARGYNQSDLLAEGFSKATSIPWSGSVLQRVKYTVSQTGKTKTERRENVRDVFVVKDKAEGKTVIVIDDVLTTGATLEACVEALKKGGYKNFYIATIAAANH